MVKTNNNSYSFPSYSGCFCILSYAEKTVNVTTSWVAAQDPQDPNASTYVWDVASSSKSVEYLYQTTSNIILFTISARFCYLPTSTSSPKRSINIRALNADAPSSPPTADGEKAETHKTFVASAYFLEVNG